MGIDPGTAGNWLTCVSTLGRSFILDIKKVKSSNQWYNKKVGTLKEGRPQGFWNEELAEITEKRNKQMRDAVNKAARLVINYCLRHRLGNVVFGWKQGHKDGSSMGKRNNQNHVQIPTAKLRERLKQICEEVGIQFQETEESYTSKASFLDNDVLPKYGAKPKKWKPSGIRNGRNYKTANGLIINADAQAAANIIRKVATQLGFDLTKIVRAVLTLPKRYNIFRNLKKSYRRCAAEFHSA